MHTIPCLYDTVIDTAYNDKYHVFVIHPKGCITYFVKSEKDGILERIPYVCWPAIDAMREKLLSSLYDD